jgi:hypothetical protein
MITITIHSPKSLPQDRVLFLRSVNYLVSNMVQLKGIIAIMAASCVSAASASTYEHALRLMKESPLIDSHIDLPQILRSLSKLCSKSSSHVRCLDRTYALGLQVGTR